MSDDKCDCLSCQSTGAPCGMDCDIGSDEECIGCYNNRMARLDDEFEQDKAQGRR